MANTFLLSGKGEGVRDAGIFFSFFSATWEVLKLLRRYATYLPARLQMRAEANQTSPAKQMRELKARSSDIPSDAHYCSRASNIRHTSLLKVLRPSYYVRPQPCCPELHLSTPRARSPDMPMSDIVREVIDTSLGAGLTLTSDGQRSPGECCIPLGHGCQVDQRIQDIPVCFGEQPSLPAFTRVLQVLSLLCLGHPPS